jgi:hypothetical protein
MLLNEIDNKDRDFVEELVKLSGYAELGGLKKVLKKEEKEFENKFDGLVKMVEFAFSDRAIELMKDYALTLDVKKQNARHMLEYCEVNRLDDLKTKMIDKMINCGNPCSKEWAEIYQIEQLFSNGEIDLNEAVKRYSSVNPKHPETKIGLEIYKSYCYLQKQEYGMIYHSVITINDYFDQIKEPYILNHYQGRVNLLLIEQYIRKGNLELARDLCEQLLNNKLDLYKSWAYLHLGNSWIVESFEKSMDYYMKGYELSYMKYEKVNLNLKRSINFLCNTWKEEPKFLNIQSTDNSDIHEIAFYYINKNQKTEAEKTLNRLNVVEMTCNQRGFHYLLRGMLSGNVDDFSESVMNFMDSGDYYFRKLPLLELKKLNCPDGILRALSK